MLPHTWVHKAAYPQKPESSNINGRRQLSELLVVRTRQKAAGQDEDGGRGEGTETGACDGPHLLVHDGLEGREGDQDCPAHHKCEGRVPAGVGDSQEARDLWEG